MFLYNVIVPAFLIGVEFGIDELYNRKEKDIEFWLKKYATYIGLSFLPANLLSQSVVLDISLKSMFGKGLLEFLMSALETMTGAPILNVYKLGKGNLERVKE